MSDDLPQGWISVELENHVYIAGRIGWRGLKRSEYTKSGPRFLAVKNILPNGQIDFTETDHLSLERYDESPEIQLKPNDILLTKDGTIGKVGMVDLLSGPTTVNSSILVVRPNDELFLDRYLFHYLRGPKFQEIARERITGSAIPHLFQKDIKKLRALVPPSNEQRRIVAKLETLLGKVEASQQRLAKIPVLIKRFRQSVLAAACSGRLTADWRDENGGAINPPDQPKPSQSSFELSPDVEIEPLPEKWRWIPIGNLSEFQQGMQIAKVTRLKEPGAGRLPILRTFNYANGFSEDVDYVEVTKDSLIAEADDIVLSRTGTIGKVLTGVRGIFHNNSFRLNYDQNLLTRKYLICWLEGPSVQNFIEAVSGRSAQPDLTHKAFGPLPFPLPPLHEQREIVRRVEGLFALADQLELRLAKARAQVDKLTPSLLARAFAGKLVPQDPNDEPASVLLERIRSHNNTRENDHSRRKQERAG
jgi:type I restriction enzyme S subunit